MKKLYLLLLLSLPIIVFGQSKVDTTRGMISWVDTVNLRVRVNQVFRFEYGTIVGRGIEAMIFHDEYYRMDSVKYYIPSPYRVWVDSKSVLTFIKSQ